MFKRTFFLPLLLALFLTACGGENQPQEPSAMFDRVDAALQSQGYERESVTRVVTAVLADEQGNEILYHYCETSFFGEIPSDFPLPNLSAIQAVVEEDKIQSTEVCKVCALDALRYRTKDGSFLCWSTDPEHTLVIQYDPSAVTDAEIMTMAESLPANHQ